MIEETLSEIGLSKNEIKIYLALLELGPSLMGQICGKTKIHRRNVYDSIEMLKEKGFVSSTLINNRNVFESVTPKRILDILDEKKTSIELVLPELLSRQNKKQTTVKVYTGQNGRKIIFEDKLNYIETQYVLGAHEPSKKISNYIENYHRRRLKKGIALKMLYVNNALDAAKKFSKYGLVKARILPDKFNSPIAINVYSNKTAIFMGSEKTEQISILIEDKELASEFIAYFEMLWKISKEIK